MKRKRNRKRKPWCIEFCSELNLDIELLRIAFNNRRDRSEQVENWEDVRRLAGDVAVRLVSKDNGYEDECHMLV